MNQLASTPRRAFASAWRANSANRLRWTVSGSRSEPCVKARAASASARCSDMVMVECLTSVRPTGVPAGTRPGAPSSAFFRFGGVVDGSKRQKWSEN